MANKKICLIFGHHDTEKSFNAAIKDAFIDEAKKNGFLQEEIIRMPANNFSIIYRKNCCK